MFFILQGKRLSCVVLTVSGKTSMTTGCSFPIAKILATSPIVINIPTRELLSGEAKFFVQRFEHLNNKNNVSKQISSL